MVDAMPFAKLIKYKLESIAYPMSLCQTILTNMATSLIVTDYLQFTRDQQLLLHV